MHICVHPGFLLEINFAFCACICLSFFLMQLSVYPVTVFLSWYATDAGSHIDTELKTVFVM